MTNGMIDKLALAAFALGMTLAGAMAGTPATPGVPPPGFKSANSSINGSSLHYVSGGQGPAVILLHGFPEDWVEYQAIMPRLAKQFTVVVVDLPGIGHSAPPHGGYDAANLAAQIHDLAEHLHLKRPYLVGHDLGGVVSYAYIRRFPDALRGAMILDVPLPGMAGWDEATKQFWHIGFIQTPGLAEKMVPGRQEAFLGWSFGMARFTKAERSYYVKAYRAPQLHSAFEIYRAFPRDAEWNAAQTSPISLPMVIAVGAKSFFAPMQQTFIDGYRAKGITNVEGAQIPNAGHYVVADNPDGVAELIEKHALEGAN